MRRPRPAVTTAAAVPAASLSLLGAPGGAATPASSTAGATAAWSPPTGPYPVGTAVAGYAAGMVDPTGAPPGVKRWTCRPTAAHPGPVRLPGTSSALQNSWRALGPLLADDGWCVHGLDYDQDALTADTGGRVSSVGEIRASAARLAGSTLLRQMDAPDDTVAGVRYDLIETDHDEVVTPYASALLQGPAVAEQDGLAALEGHLAGFAPDCEAPLPVVGTP